MTVMPCNRRCHNNGYLFALWCTIICTSDLGGFDFNKTNPIRICAVQVIFTIPSSSLTISYLHKPGGSDKLPFQPLHLCNAMAQLTGHKQDRDIREFAAYGLEHKCHCNETSPTTLTSCPKLKKNEFCKKYFIS